MLVSFFTEKTKTQVSYSTSFSKTYVEERKKKLWKVFNYANILFLYTNVILFFGQKVFVISLFGKNLNSSRKIMSKFRNQLTFLGL